VRERLKGLAEGVGRDPRELEILTTFRLRVPVPETEDSAERDVGELLQLGEAGVDLWVLAISPTRAETLSRVAEDVVPRLRRRLGDDLLE
jgi:alkanesulfonate monooxygenase SsuD/methylene tetrahydromethanopterin reductase-like flavin-dependent oxidoreductase (luciferase family)